MSPIRPELQRVLAEITAERAAQDAKWGESNHPDHVPGQGRAGLESYEHAVTHWKDRNTHRANRGDLAWDGILMEEAFEACAAHDPAALRIELVHVAAVAAAWIEAIDRRTAPPAGSDAPDPAHVHTDACMCDMGSMEIPGAEECSHCGGHTGGPCGSLCEVAYDEIVKGTTPNPARTWAEGDTAIWHDEDGEPRHVTVLRQTPLVIKHVDSGAVTEAYPDELSEVPAPTGTEHR